MSYNTEHFQSVIANRYIGLRCLLAVLWVTTFDVKNRLLNTYTLVFSLWLTKSVVSVKFTICK